MVIVSFLLRKTFKFLSDFRRTANIYAPPNPNISQNFDHRYRYPRVFIPGLESDSPSHVFGEPTASAPGHPNRPNIVPPARHRGSSYTEYPTTRPYPEEPGHSFTLPSQPYVLDASGVPHRFTTQAQPYTTVHPFRTSRPVSVIIPTTMYEPNPPERRTSAERSSVDYPNLGNVVPPSRHGASSQVIQGISGCIILWLNPDSLMCGMLTPPFRIPPTWISLTPQYIRSGLQVRVHRVLKVYYLSLKMALSRSQSYPWPHPNPAI